jgi:adenylate kinase family enzyme
VPVLGITGTGGAGKSSLTDELVRRFRLDQDDAAQARPRSRSTPRASAPAARCSATASA